jgi:hypothetical protein
MVVIKYDLHQDGNGIKSHEFSDIWDVPEIKEYEDWFIIRFCQTLIELVDYFVVNTSTDFGNPDYNHLDGWVHGVCFAKGWTIDYVKKNGKCYDIYKCGRKYRIEVEKDD